MTEKPNRNLVRKYELAPRVRRARLQHLIDQHPLLGVPRWDGDTEQRMERTRTVCPGCGNPETHAFFFDPKRPHKVFWLCLYCRRAWGKHALPDVDDVIE